MTNSNLLTKYWTDTITLYESDEYNKLIVALIISSSISMLSSFLIAAAFIYLLVSTPEKANRISLRCVFMASVMNVIYSAFDLGIVLSVGDSPFCRASGIIYIFSQIMSAAFLALVGINLILVFVINVPCTAKQLERFYYPGALLYGLITISVPISQIVGDPFSDENYRCYYFFFYYRVFGSTNLYWMWYYGCLCLSVAVATICSIVALIKLVREHHRVIDRFIHIASTSETVETANSHIQQRLRNQSNVFFKVVSRCIAYPLVPLISNIWGFVFQLLTVKPNSNLPFAFSMMDVIFKCLQGLFVALVFFSDPSMSHFIVERWSFYKEKYVENYTQVRQYSSGQVEIIQTKKDKQRASNASFTLLPASMNTNAITSVHDGSTRRSSSTITDVVYCHKVFHYHNDFTYIESSPYQMDIAIPETAYTSHCQEEKVSAESNHNRGLPSIPTPTAVESSCSPYQFIPDPESKRRILVPYKYPRLATVVHWVLTKLGFKGKRQEEGDILNSIHFTSPSMQQSNQRGDSVEFVNIHPAIPFA